MDQSERYTYMAHISENFQPSSPVDTQIMFSGRSQQIDSVFQAILLRGQHVIIYGERGVGKTSFARVISQIVNGSKQIQLLDSGTINADSTDTFSSLWHKISELFP